MIVGELDKGRMLTVSQPRNYVNNVIINPRLNYSPVNYSRTYSGYYPQQGIYTNPEGYGPISYTEEYNKDIIVCYLDSSLKLQQQTVIVKKQSDMKKVSSVYLGFGTVNTSSAIHFLYREVKKAGGVIRNTSFSASGKLMRLPPLKTFDDMYKLIPANAKQVGLREVIIPGTYRGKTFFAKIDL